MSETFRPNDEEQLREVVAWALSNETPLEVVGAGSKRALGRPGNLPARVETGAMSGILWYEPAELALSAAAGTPLAEIEAALAENNQQLAFEPPDLGPLLGEPAGAATLGGTIACNLSGPRRVSAGAARDHFLGLRAVSGRAEIFKSGGRVVKNVSGYDLCKVVAGSYGTIAVLSEITVKVLPAPEKTRTVLAYAKSDTDGIAALGAAASSPLSPTGLAHLTAEAASSSAVDYVNGTAGSVTAVRVEGTETSVLARTQALRDLLGKSATVEELHGHNSRAFWREIATAAPLATHAGPVWRLSLPPAVAAAVVADIPCEARFYDWAGGLAWVAMAPGGDGGAAAIRGAIQAAGAGGYATLIRGDAELRARIPVFEPQAAPLAALSARLKEQFDPEGVLNPGRMVAEG
ncbi:MAG: glycolate oxidase subunit GlcE [Alphaproteobacteria bacterium]|jgi:glycolate oxidase FAD binding subunit|nr:glycolate oxidase subunit GlcE [Alphaproteobacteria bacterium]